MLLEVQVHDEEDPSILASAERGHLSTGNMSRAKLLTLLPGSKRKGKKRKRKGATSSLKSLHDLKILHLQHQLKASQCLPSITLGIRPLGPSGDTENANCNCLHQQIDE